MPNMFKIGYINDNEYYDDYQTIYDMYNFIIKVSKKYRLNSEFKLVKYYTKEECDLIIYSLASVHGDKMYWNKYFNEALGNPKWLFFDVGEPHHVGLTQSKIIGNDEGCQWGDDRILRTLCYYKHPRRGYSMTPYENIPTNFQVIPFIRWNLYNGLRDLIESGNLERKRNIKKDYFCSIIASDTTPERYNFCNYIKANYKNIRSFGKTLNNMGNVFFDDEKLNDIIPHHKFNICFENTRSDFNEAYITEKIYRAYMWGTVPIYWGENNYIYDFLNKDSFINLTGLSLKESLEIIKEYDNNDKLYNDMLYTNPLNESYDLQLFEIKKELFIVKILTDI